jgi:deoxyribodipyrimidine photolyase-related protein
VECCFSMSSFHTLRLILGDQLNAKHSWYKTKDKGVLYALMEVRTETDYAHHHIQKVVGFFTAMRGFSDALKKGDHEVIYFNINDAENKQSFTENIKLLIKSHGIKKFEYQLPDEYRLDQEFLNLTNELEIETKVVDTEHFYTSRNELKAQFEDKKQILMESFYRAMRKKHDVMMLNGKPLSGKWNYDAENRKKLPTGTSVPEPLVFNHDVTEVVDQIKEAGIQTIGTINAKAYAWPVSRKESIELLHYFLEHCLPQFGDYQDAMHQNYWSLFHARLSFSLNAKMISPKEVVDAAINYWETNQDTIHISQIEGFVRQILGWREYMRGIYWWKMPHFKTLNFFENKNPLPDWFWTGETKMACLKSAITQSLEYSYAHHIQRLMVTGNFALLAGVDPDEVDAWYLGIYIDAIEWVEITNTRGMSQFADGGIIATKPYVSSASYIHKMSSHCKSCFYDHKKKTGEGACPFNSLYWNFYDQHSDKLSGNPRIGMMLNIWNKMKPETKAEYLLQASKYLSEVNYL